LCLTGGGTLENFWQLSKFILTNSSNITTKVEQNNDHNCYQILSTSNMCVIKMTATGYELQRVKGSGVKEDIKNTNN
jgi:hypothetical protein